MFCLGKGRWDQRKKGGRKEGPQHKKTRGAWGEEEWETKQCVRGVPSVAIMLTAGSLLLGGKKKGHPKVSCRGACNERQRGRSDKRGGGKKE